MRAQVVRTVKVSQEKYHRIMKTLALQEVAMRPREALGLPRAQQLAPLAEQGILDNPRAQMCTPIEFGKQLFRK